MIAIQIYDRFLWNQLQEMCKSLSPLKDENKICEGVYSYEKIYALMLMLRNTAPPWDEYNNRAHGSELGSN